MTKKLYAVSFSLTKICSYTEFLNNNMNLKKSLHKNFKLIRILVKFSHSCCVLTICSKMISFVSIVIFWISNAETFLVVDNTGNFSHLVDGVSKVIDEIFINNSETANFMSPNSSSSSSFLIKDFKDALGLKAFQNPKVVYRHEFASNDMTFQSRKRRMTVFLAENLQDFKREHAVIKPGFFKFNGFFLILLMNGRIFEIETIFKLLWKIQIYNVIVMFEENNEVLVYTFFPFNAMKCDDTTPFLINKIVDGNFLNGSENIFPDKMENLFNCPIRLSTAEHEVPFVNVAKLSNDSYKLEGLDITFLNILAEKLNFKIEFTSFAKESYIFENGTMSGAFKVLSDGRADMTISSWYLKPNRLRFFDSTTTYSYDSLVFLVPPGAKLTPFEKLIYPFTSVVWFMVLGVFLVGFVVIQILKRQKPSVKNFIFGTRVKHPILNMFSGFIGGVQKVLPKRNFARFLLMSFLMYSIVVRTLYQASYFQLIKSDKTSKIVQTIDEIIRKDFKIYIMPGNDDLLVGIPELKKRLHYSNRKLE